MSRLDKMEVLELRKSSRHITKLQYRGLSKRKGTSSQSNWCLLPPPRFPLVTASPLPSVEKTDLLRLLHREGDGVTWGSCGVVGRPKPCCDGDPEVKG